MQHERTFPVNGTGPAPGAAPGSRRVRGRLCRLLAVAIACGLCNAAALAQQGAAGEATRLLAQLQNADVLDPYFQNEVLATALPLVQAAAGRWSGVQVNDQPRPGWINIYLVDGEQIPDDGLNLGDRSLLRDDLKSGGWTHRSSQTILLDSSRWKRLVAATVMTQRRAPRDLIQALATVDATGLAALEPLWSEPAMRADTPENRGAGMLIRGALGYVLAHEIGHLTRAEPVGAGAAPRLPPALQADLQLRRRSQACNEYLRPEAAALKSDEREADRYAAQLIGQQCLIGDDGKLRHQIVLLGMAWYLTAAIGDKLLEMAVAPDTTPLIDGRMRTMLSPALHDRLKASHGRPVSGVVAIAFPSTHPPDTERLRLLESDLAQTRCGGSSSGSVLAQALEAQRLQMCNSLGDGK
jgi:hypothetical protein